MNSTQMTAAHGLRRQWAERLAQVRSAVQQHWQAAPPWVRTPTAIAAGVALLALALLTALALVVQGVVERGEELNQAWAADQNRHVVTTTAAAGPRP